MNIKLECCSEIPYLYKFLKTLKVVKIMLEL